MSVRKRDGSSVLEYQAICRSKLRSSLRSPEFEVVGLNCVCIRTCLQLQARMPVKFPDSGDEVARYVIEANDVIVSQLPCVTKHLSHHQAIHLHASSAACRGA